MTPTSLQARSRIIIRSVCEIYAITPRRLRARTKAREVTIARGVAIYLLHNAGVSLRKLAKTFDIAGPSAWEHYHRTKDDYGVNTDFRQKVQAVEVYLQMLPEAA